MMNCDQITVNTQSSIRIDGSKIVYFDPFKIGEGSHDADVICITHDHYDHFDVESIGRIRKEDTVFFGPAVMSPVLKEIADDAHLHLLSPGDRFEAEDYTVYAFPAYNKLKPFHPKRNAFIGYLLEMDGIRYYAAGDTDAVNELETVECDIAMVPIGGKFTMNAKDAAGLINVMKPSVAIPIHYGSIVGKPADADTFRSLVDPGIEVVVKLK